MRERYNRERDFEQCVDARKADIFRCVELLAVEPLKRAEMLDMMRAVGLPDWLKEVNFRAAKALNFVQFEPVRKGGIVRAIMPGDVIVKDLSQAQYVVRITPLGEALLKANPVSI